MYTTYDKNNKDCKGFDLPASAIAALCEYGRVICLGEQKSNPEYAHCWQCFTFWVEDHQPHFTFAGIPDDLGLENGVDAYAIQYVSYKKK